MKRDGVDARLLEAVVIYEQSQDGASGAQAAAPGHSARPPYRAPSAPAQPAITSESAVLQHQVEQLLFHQAELLDRKCWQEFIDLFAADGVYWMPVAPEQTDWLDTPSIFIEDKTMMEVRKGRVTHPNAWSQAPMWGTSHIVGNVVIESHAEASIVARSRFQVLELRRDSVRHFGGSYRHTLVREGVDLKISLQRVDLLTSQALFDYVLQVWI